MLTEQNLQLLSQTFLFKGCESQEIRELLESAGSVYRSYEKKEQIYSPEHYRKELGILLKGKVRVTKGNTDLVISVLVPGSLFGAAALFTEETEYVSTLTVKEKADVLFLTQEAVSGLIDENKQVRDNYIRYLSGRIRFLSDKVDSLSTGKGVKKLADFLLRNMNEQGEVLLPFSMSELAKRLDTSRATLYRDMQQLEDGGVIQRDKKIIRIPDREALHLV